MSNKMANPGYMAWLVGEALKAGGIKVLQTKEKFGSIRVYVNVPNSHAARMHYREVYMAAMASSPELADNLRGSADYSEWLFDNEAQLDGYIALQVAKAGAGFLEAWSPRWELARKLIRGQDTSGLLEGAEEIEEDSEATEASNEVTISREKFEAACAAVAWACVQSGGGGWTELYVQMNAALNNDSNNKEKK
jgi:hypothetical protein